MRWKSDDVRYGLVARTLHWLIAVAIFAMLGSGLAADQQSGSAAAVGILRFHAVAGVSVVVLTILRLLWWMVADRKPPATSATPRWQATAAGTVHWTFYAVILLLGASGMAMMALSGAGNVLFGGSVGPLPDFEDFAPRGPHGLLAWVLLLLIAAHVGAGLYHQFVLKDRLLGRMGLGAP